MSAKPDFYKRARTTQSLLDYVFDWAPLTNGDDTQTDWLEPGERIDTFVITKPAEVATQDEVKVDNDTGVRVWIDVALTPVGKYLITCSITVLNSPKKESRTLELEVV